MSAEQDKELSVATADSRLSVKPGDGQDVCSLCGIHRMNAGFFRETCGPNYLAPECFVMSTKERSED